MSACCGPIADHGEHAPTGTHAVSNIDMPDRDPKAVRRGMVRIPAGSFWMGGDDPDAFPDDGEGPVREVHVSEFFIDPKAVTNAQFAAFVKATGYLTEAERFGWSFVFHHFVTGQARRHIVEGRVPQAPWWVAVSGADWRHPEGPGSKITARQNHPVVHVSWQDAATNAAWAGKRLPTEAEWEKAARGGLVRARFPWGNEFTVRGRHRCNTWQGVFPRHNTGEDGHLGAAPVDAFRPNGFGLFNTSGNVWEWCADWFSRDFHTRDRRTSPGGPRAGTHKTTRGGSYLCHHSYCRRYRVSARNAVTPDSSTGNIGFRCVVPA